MSTRTDKLLKFEKSWRFKSPGPMPQGVIHDFYDLIEKIAAQGMCSSQKAKGQTIKAHRGGVIGKGCLEVMACSIH